MTLSAGNPPRQWVYPNTNPPPEEECFICSAEVPVSVEFLPCGHKSCLGCLERLKAGNIFKADTGVQCPFCRQFVDRYVCSLKDAYAVKVVGEANSAAQKASLCRAETTSSQQSQCCGNNNNGSNYVDDGSSGEMNGSNTRVNWPCPYCGNINYYWRETCNKCGKPDPKVQFGRGSKPQDLMSASANDIVQFSKEKMHPNLTIAMQEAGVSYVNGQLEVSVETLRSAFPAQGHRKLVRVVQSLALTNQIQQVAIHFFGNYTIQDLLVCTALLREGACAHPQVHKLKDAVETYSLLHRGLLNEIATTAIHPQGSFVIQKWVDTCSMEELIEGAREIVKQGPSVAADIRGVHIFGKMVQRLREQRFLDGEFMEQILPLMTLICDRFCQEHEHMIWVAHHFIGGKALVNAIEAALPRISALRLAGQIAAQASKLITTKAGMKTLCNLVEIREEDQGCPEIFREIPILVCWYLNGNFVDLVLNIVQGGTQLVRLLLERLGEEQEMDWIDAVLSEIVCDSDRIVDNPEAIEVLTWGLSLPVLDSQTVRAYINNIREIDVQMGQKIEDAVRTQLTSASQKIVAKYVEPSYLQPSLWIQLREEGVVAKRPPPPPPERPKNIQTPPQHLSKPPTPPTPPAQYFAPRSPQQSQPEESMAKELLGSDLIDSLTNIVDGNVNSPQQMTSYVSPQTSYAPTPASTPLAVMRPLPPPNMYRQNIQNMQNMQSQAIGGATPVNLDSSMPMYMNRGQGVGVGMGQGQGQSQIYGKPPQYPTPHPVDMRQQQMAYQIMQMQQQPQQQQQQQQQMQYMQHAFSRSQQLHFQHQFKQQQLMSSSGSGWQCSNCSNFNFGRDSSSCEYYVCGACGLDRYTGGQVQQQQQQLQTSPPHPLQTPPRVTG